MELVVTYSFWDIMTCIRYQEIGIKKQDRMQKTLTESIAWLKSYARSKVGPWGCILGTSQGCMFVYWIIEGPEWLWTQGLLDLVGGMNKIYGQVL
jgi:hypothetical protein